MMSEVGLVAKGHNPPKDLIPQFVHTTVKSRSSLPSLSVFCSFVSRVSKCFLERTRKQQRRVDQDTSPFTMLAAIRVHRGIAPWRLNHWQRYSCVRTCTVAVCTCRNLGNTVAVNT